MESASTVVIKVNYGEVLRRFSAPIVEGELAFTVDGLKDKILSLFSLSHDVELILTYVDEDGDIVRLVDADDMRDVVKQGLNPLRITVQLSSQPNAVQSSSSTPQGQQPLQNLHTGVAEILKTLPKPLSETLVNLSSDITTKALASSPHLAELVDTFSKVGLSYLDQASESKAREKPSKSKKPEKSLLKVEKNKDADVCKVNDDKLKVSSSSLQGQTLDNSINAKKVQPTGVKEDKLELGDESTKVLKTAIKSRLSKDFPLAQMKKLNKINDCYLNGKSQSGPIWNPDNMRPWSRFLPHHHPNFSDLVWNSSPLFVPQPFYPAPHRVGSFENTTSMSDGPVYHCGVRCDGCGIHPVVGPRFKSKVKLNYDLCSTCFSKMGNSTDYIRMDLPAFYPNNIPLDGFCNPALNLPPMYCKSPKSLSRPSKLDCHFIQDVCILDGTVMAPLTPFKKVWRVRNNGTVEWLPKTGLVFIGGNLLRSDRIADLEIPPTGVAVGQELDITVDFVAPEQPGKYISYWRMASPQGRQFGQRIWVLIQVEGSVQTIQSENVINGLNLNLPPESSSSTTVLGSLGVPPEPVPAVEDGKAKNKNDQMKVDQLVEPTVETEGNYSQGMKFPINGSLLVGDGASSSHTTPSDPFPVIQNNDPLPLLPNPVSSSGITNYAPSSSEHEPEIELPGKMEIEEKLLKELEQMGFKEIDLNKEALRMNEYDLEQAVDDLCDSDWDPILDELREMGFGNVEMNKKLLEKNKGSITRVVMDLIAEEEEEEEENM